MFWLSALRFGFFFLLLLRITTSFALLRRRLDGTPATVEGKTYSYVVDRTNRRVTEVRVGIPVRDVVRFVIRDEREYDGLAKRLGISSEWQTGDASFDKSRYLLCDDPVMLRALSQDAQLRESVVELAGATGGGTLVCHGGDLFTSDERAVQQFKGDDDADDERIAAASAGRVVPVLERIRDRVQAIQAGPWSTARDPGHAHQFALVSITTFLGVAAIAGFFWLSVGTDIPGPIQAEQVPVRAAVIAGAIGIALLLMLIALMRKSSRSHLVILEVLLIGLPGAWVTSDAALTWANMNLDRTPAQVHETNVSNLYVTNGRRGRKYHHLVVSTPPPGTSRTRYVVAPRTYLSLRTGECVRFIVRSGHFGDAWVSRVEPSACSGKGSW